MMIIEKIRHRYDPYIGDAQPIAADLTVSTAAELPSLGAKIGTLYAAAAGTRADVIHTGMRYTLDADGKWYTSSVYETKSVSGGEITFTGNGTLLIDYTIRGNCVQDGTPTLDEPVWAQALGAKGKGRAVIRMTANGADTIINLAEPLRAVGGIADEINFQTQTVTRKIAQASYVGAADEFSGWTSMTQGWTSVTGGMFYVFYPPDLLNQGTAPALCSHYVCQNIPRTQQDADMKFCYDTEGYPGAAGFTAMKPNISAAGAAQLWKTLFAEQKDVMHIYPDRTWTAMPVTVWYPLAPQYWTTEHIDLPEIQTVRGENTVTVIGDGISPSGIDIAYR